MVTQIERITKIEHTLYGNGVRGVISRLERVENELIRTRMMLIATLVAASVGGVQGIALFIEKILKLIL